MGTETAKKSVRSKAKTYKSKRKSKNTLLSPKSPRVKPVSKSKQNSKSMSMVVDEIIPKPLEYIVYHTEQVKRPICVVKIRDATTWMTPNIAYYKSTGKSNDRFGGKFSNTWFPIATILENAAIVGGKNLEEGFVFKMSAFLESPFLGEWGCLLLNDHFKKKYLEKYEEYVTDILTTSSAAKNPNPVTVKELETKYNMTTLDVHETYKILLEEYIEIHDFISGYFVYDWQLYISAFAGSGYWQQNEQFRDYILSAIVLNRENFVMPDFSELNTLDGDNSDIDNTPLVIDFLKSNKCFMTAEQLNSNVDFFRKQPESSCSSLTRFKYSFIVQKVPMLKRAKAASEKYAKKI